MKLDPILSQYFHTHNELHLVGIGSFFKEPGHGSDDESKQGRQRYQGQIRFERNISKVNDAELVEFISANTGKMKTLADSDLHSFLELAIQFLNIGKAFVLEDIGTLVKNNEGNLRFIPYNEPEKYKDPASVDATTTINTEEAFGPYNDKSRNKGNNWQKPIAFLLLVGGVALAIWGGYWLYRNASNNKTETPTAVPDQIVPIEDTVQTTLVSDTINTFPAASQGYKFILETGNKERAQFRYAQLSSYYWDVKLETLDSLTYKIYMQLPVNATDTTKVKDSLTLLTGRQVNIEQ